MVIVVVDDVLVTMTGDVEHFVATTAYAQESNAATFATANTVLAMHVCRCCSPGATLLQ